MQKRYSFFLPIIIILLSLFRYGCVDIPSDIIAPQWDVDLNLPIINRSYTLDDIIKDQEYISVSGTTPENSIYILQSDDYNQSVGISQFIKVTQGTNSRNNIIPADNNGSNTIYLTFPEGAKIDSATFQSGTFSYNISNPSLVPVNVTLTVPGIIKNDGNPFSISKSIPSKGQDSVTVDFSSYKYRLPAAQPPFLKNSLMIILDVKATVTTGTNIIASFYSSDFLFKTVTGYIPKKSLGEQTESFSIDLGSAKDYRGKAFLRDASLDLDANYSSPYPNPFDIEVKNLNIIGERSDGTQFYLKDSTGNQNLTFLFTNGDYHKTFSKTGSNINSFMSFLPDKILLKAEYIMNPNNTTGSATDKDSVKFKASFSSTSFMALKKSSITDTTSIDLSNDDRDNIRKGRAANLNIDVENGIPLTAWINVVVTDQNYNPLFSVQNTTTGNDSLYFLGADVGANGEVTSATTGVKQSSFRFFPDR